MSQLEEREQRRKQSIISSTVNAPKQAIKSKSKKNVVINKSKMLQKSYYIKKDFFKALQQKTITEEITLT